MDGWMDGWIDRYWYLHNPTSLARWRVARRAIGYPPPRLQQGAGRVESSHSFHMYTEGSPHTPRCPPAHRFQPAVLVSCCVTFFYLPPKFSKMPPDASRMPPRCPQDASKMLQYAFKMPPRWSMMPPRCLQDLPRPPKMFPRRPKTTPRHLKMSSKSLKINEFF